MVSSEPSSPNHRGTRICSSTGSSSSRCQPTQRVEQPSGPRKHRSLRGGNHVRLQVVSAKSSLPGLQRRPSTEQSSEGSEAQAVGCRRCSRGTSSRRASSFAAHFLSGKPPAKHNEATCSRRRRHLSRVEAPDSTSSTYRSLCTPSAPRGNRLRSSSASLSIVLNARIICRCLSAGCT
ncbi:uncharacterized protein LOC143895307 [Temnothorax americanus]|uniref:uncharacterized protein LOC143895307 n=1 Tax=Temnothorax americanus TaxID=1964332 RepID=UPI004067F487